MMPMLGWARRLRMATVLAVCVPAAVAGLSLNAMAQSPSPAPSGSAAPIGDPTKGQQVYNANCTSCHGASLEGSQLGPRLNPLAKLNGVTDPKDPDYLIQTVSDGRDGKADGFGMMPAWKGKLSDQDIKDVVQYILNENAKGTNAPYTPAELARSQVFWVTVGTLGMLVITYLLAVYNIRWIGRRAAMRRGR